MAQTLDESVWLIRRRGDIAWYAKERATIENDLLVAAAEVIRARPGFAMDAGSMPHVRPDPHVTRFSLSGCPWPPPCIPRRIAATAFEDRRHHGDLHRTLKPGPWLEADPAPVGRYGAREPTFT